MEKASSVLKMENKVGYWGSSGETGSELKPGIQSKGKADRKDRKQTGNDLHVGEDDPAMRGRGTGAEVCWS